MEHERDPAHSVHVGVAYTRFSKLKSNSHLKSTRYRIKYAHVRRLQLIHSIRVRATQQNISTQWADTIAPPLTSLTVLPCADCKISVDDGDRQTDINRHHQLLKPPLTTWAGHNYTNTIRYKSLTWTEKLSVVL